MQSNTISQTTYFSDFTRLWAAQAISLFGTRITMLAIPLTAVNLLDVSESQMGLLDAAGKLPFVVFGLFAGVWLDCVFRRPVMIAADILRAILLFSIPLAVLGGWLSVGQLFAIAFAVGTFDVFFEIAHLAYIPAIFPASELLDKNSKIQLSYSLSETVGPGLAGFLIQALTAPIAISLDAISFLGSALLLHSIHRPEPIAQDKKLLRNLRQAITDGLRSLLGDPYYRPIMLATAVAQFFTQGLFAIYILYASRIGIEPFELGFLFTLGGVGSILGALITNRFTSRVGLGPSIIGGWLLELLALFLIPLASGNMLMVMLGMAHLLNGLAGTVVNINQWSLRQAVTPANLHARVTACHRFIMMSAMSVGSLCAGLLAGQIGIRPVLFLAAAGGVSSVLLLFFSPLRELVKHPTLSSE